VLQKWNEFDDVVGSTVEAEVARHLDHMKALGVNEIWYPIRSADAHTRTRDFGEASRRLGRGVRRHDHSLRYCAGERRPLRSSRR